MTTFSGSYWSGVLSDENVQALLAERLGAVLTDQIHLELAILRMPPLLQFSYRRSVHTNPGMLDYVLTHAHSSVPTNDHVMVPETLLKKRKSQEKARAERTAAAEKKKAVSISHSNFPSIMMHNIPLQLDSVDAV